MKKVGLARCWLEISEADGRHDYDRHFQWLKVIPSITSIVVFGCWALAEKERDGTIIYSGGTEAYALLWTLEAKKAKVIDKSAEQIANARNRKEIMTQAMPYCLEGRELEFIVADMTSAMPSLQDGEFDIAYCEDVLYTFWNQDEGGNQDLLVRVIQGISRVVKSGGWIIAIEPMAGGNYRIEGFMRVEEKEPQDISAFFEKADLIVDTTIDRATALRGTYVFRKP